MSDSTRPVSAESVPGVVAVLNKHRVFVADMPDIWGCSCRATGTAPIERVWQEALRHVAEAVLRELAGCDHGHWAASAFPDADLRGVQHFTCECGLPWTPGEGCPFVQGVRFGLARVTPPVRTD